MRRIDACSRERGGQIESRSALVIAARLLVAAKKCVVLRLVGLWTKPIGVFIGAIMVYRSDFGATNE